MSTSTDSMIAQMERDIQNAEDYHSHMWENRHSAEAVFLQAVEAVGIAAADLTVAKSHLIELKNSLCPSCSCLKGDHAKSEDGDPRTGWVCYDCGREEECPR
ncbi:hypothetical protein LCGC14_0740390 [marine sediment metagenome]|uniref:Uncharacterized protein n=1 Tax=marine sediment metagenome TaxID=412755 RepID=A0A0F9Q6V7_9ZZZZ